MRKQEQPPMGRNYQEPLSVFVEKIGDRGALVHGDISKETLKELLMSSLMLVPAMSTYDEKLPQHHKVFDVKTADLEKSFRKISKIFERTDDDKEKIDEFEERKEMKEIKEITEVTPSDVSRPVEKDLKKEKKKKQKDSKKETKHISKDKAERGLYKKMGKKVLEDYGEGYPARHDDEISKVEEGKEEKLEEDIETESWTFCTSDSDEFDLSFDGKWLRKYMKVPLKMAIKEIVAKKPYDPIGYLGFWLLNYRKSQENEQLQLEERENMDYLRSLIKETLLTDKEEECVMDNRDEGEEEEIQDLNFKYYDTRHIVA